MLDLKAIQDRVYLQGYPDDVAVVRLADWYAVLTELQLLYNTLASRPVFRVSE